MREMPVLISVNMDKEEVGLTFENYNLVSAGVVNKENKLVGMITADDVVTVVQEEAEVHEEEHVAYLKLYVFVEVLFLYAMCNVSFESTAISASWPRFPVSMVVIVQDDADEHEEEHVTYLRFMEALVLPNPVLEEMWTAPFESIAIEVP